jgi:very-short-patch-repair endonuclease
MDKIFNQKEQKNIRQCLRRNLPSPEILLWQKIKNRQIGGLKFRRQHGIGDYVVDFYCPERQLAIEIDGDSHYTKKGKEKDQIRDSYLETLRISVLRFTNKDVVNNIDEVLDRINKYN